MAEKKEKAKFMGNAKCPLCGSDKARVSLAKTDLTCLTCNSCNCQLFTRSDRSDELLRARIVVAPAAPAAPVIQENEPAPIPKAPAVNDAPREKKPARADDWYPL